MAYKIIAGLDIGNGYVKGLMKEKKESQPTTVDIPSGVSILTRPNAVPTKDSDVADELDDFFNKLDVTFTTPIISDSYRRLFGKRALTSNGRFEEFEIVANKSKAHQDLSRSLVLGIFAAKGLLCYYNDKKILPEVNKPIDVTAQVGLALPISEYRDFRKDYEKIFKENKHSVVIRNFETPVTVNITFDKVLVVPEGASGQYAISQLGTEIMELMLDDARKSGINLDGITADDLIAVKNTVGVDIGEGTVNFPVFTNGHFNTNVSDTFTQGYGNVLENAISSMDQQNVKHGFNSRKQLADFLITKPSPLRRKTYDKVKFYVDEESDFFSKDVAESFSRVLSGVSSTTEAVYVYGGGASPLKEFLYPKLIEKAQDVLGVDIPILYLDSRYSRNLNRQGLYIVANS